MPTFIGYCRVSTAEQANSGLGLEAQQDAIQRYADMHGWQIEWYVDAGHSAKSLDRPKLKEALDRLNVPAKHRDVDGLICSKLDRLSRSTQDFAGLLEQSKAKKWSVVAIDLGVDMTTSTGRMVAGILMQVAQFEREVIGERTSAALQAAKRRGTQIGPTSTLPEATADRLLELRQTHTLDATAATLNAEGLSTATGKLWDRHAVCKAQKRIYRAAELAEARAEYERTQAA